MVTTWRDGTYVHAFANRKTILTIMRLTWKYQSKSLSWKRWWHASVSASRNQHQDRSQFRRPMLIYWLDFHLISLLRSMRHQSSCQPRRRNKKKSSKKRRRKRWRSFLCQHRPNRSMWRNTFLQWNRQISLLILAAEHQWHLSIMINHWYRETSSTTLHHLLSTTSLGITKTTKTILSATNIPDLYKVASKIYFGRIQHTNLKGIQIHI